jgi:hypothetical protein
VADARDFAKVVDQVRLLAGTLNGCQGSATLTIEKARCHETPLQ